MYTIAYKIASQLQRKQGSFSKVAYFIGIISLTGGLTITLLAWLAFNGIHNSISNKIYAAAGHFHLLALSPASPLHLNQLQPSLDRFSDTLIRATPYVHKIGLLQYGEQVEGIVLKGIPPDHLNKLQAFFEITSIPPPEDTAYIVVSQWLTGKHDIKLGDQLVTCFAQSPPRYRKLRVIGTYQTCIQEMDQKFAFCNIKLLQQLNKWNEDQVEGIEVLLKDTALVNEEVPKWVGQIVGNVQLEQMQDRYSAIFNWLAISKEHIFAFIIIVMLVAATNIAAIIFLQIMERTEMIAILRVMGASPNLIKKIFFFRGLQIITWGLLIGNGVTLLLAYLQHTFKLVRLNPDLYYIEHVVLSFSMMPILVVNIGILVVVVVTLLLSLLFIKQINLVESLHYSD